MTEKICDKPQVVDSWNGIEVFSVNGKYGLCNPENNITVNPVYDSLEWDKRSDFIVATKGNKIGFLSAEDGHFIDLNETAPEDPYMMAIPYTEYMNEEWPEWMISSTSN